MRIRRSGRASLVLALIVAACSGPVPTLPAQPARYALDGFAFDYPASWAINDAGWATTGFGSPMAVLGTMPWGDCVKSDINCHFQERLRPGQIEVRVGVLAITSGDLCVFAAERPDLAGRGPGDPVATASLIRVDGRPAIRTDRAPGADDYYRADEYREWMIAFPDTLDHAYTIEAMYRGPGLEDLRAEVDRIIASVRLGRVSDAYVRPSPSDCPAPFPSPAAP